MVIRAPSEHTFDGKHMDVEMQFYVRRPEPILDVKEMLRAGSLYGNIMAVSVFFDRLHGGNEDNPFIETLNWDSPPLGEEFVDDDSV
jgi:hypothetical protein